MGKRIISFDLTGTLATTRFCDSIYFQGLPEIYASINNVEIEEAKRYLRVFYDEVGDRSPEWYDIKYWFERLSLGNGWMELLREMSHNIEWYPESEQVLAELNYEYDLILLTNACREFMEVETEAISKYFKRMISCVSEFGEVKKTPEFYLRVCQSLSCGTEDIIHVGDHWHFDYVAPRGCGMTAFYLDRSGRDDGDFTIHQLSDLRTRMI
ncbi:MAG: HAD family hydrolase [Dehalococcoidia bacterium]